MPQIRVEKVAEFSMISNSTLQDQALSFKARGLLGYMLSLPGDWDYSIAGLAEKSKADGIRAIRSGIDELMKAGYVYRYQSRDEKGNFDGYEYVVREIPLKQGEQQEESPSCCFASTDFATSRNSTQQSTNSTKKKEKKSKKEKKAPAESDMLFDRFWAAYPKKKGKESARRAWRKLAPDLALCRVMAEALDRQKRSGDWQREGGQFIPYPATWLNGRRWEDEPDGPAAPAYNEEGYDGI